MPKFKGVVDLVDAIQIVTNFSEDSLAATVIFRNVEVSVSGDALAGPLIGTKVVTLRIPVLDNPAGSTAVLDVRGRIVIGGTARAVLVVQAGGELTRIEPAQSVKDEVYHHRIHRVPVKSNQLLVTIFLIAEREAPGLKDAVMFSVDSMDVTLGS